MIDLKELIFKTLDDFSFETSREKNDDYYKTRLEKAFDRAFNNLKGINTDRKEFDKSFDDEMI